jgi:serine/threonine-protein kinase
MSMVEQLLAGRYRLQERIALGGMGAVWRATDEVLNRPVAVKVLYENLAADPAAAARFKREALTAASIFHPNMANVFDYVEEHHMPGIVMELVPGETLAQRIAREGALPVGEASRIAASVLRALEAAHAAGVVHRDIKPGNILLTPDGTVKVTDFGIAHTLGESSLTQTGMVLGTAHYSAPEQIRGEDATPSSDLYAVGVVLYEMLTGRRPFDGDTPAAVAMARLSEAPPPLRFFKDAVPPPLEDVVMRALALAPAGRFGSATEMREAIELAADHQATTLMPALMGEDPTIPIAVMPLDERTTPVVPAAVKRKLVPWLLPLAGIALLTTLLVLLFFGGPSVARVPSLTGTSLSRATVLARDAGLKVSATTSHSSRPKGTVLSQSVPADKMVSRGSTVALVVSDGIAPCCTVPDLTGDSEADARAALADAHLSVGAISYTFSTDGQTGVIGQYPAGGAHAKAGSTVDLTVVQPLPQQDQRHGKRHGEG